MKILTQQILFMLILGIEMLDLLNKVDPLLFKPYFATESDCQSTFLRPALNPNNLHEQFTLLYFTILIFNNY